MFYLENKLSKKDKTHYFYNTCLCNNMKGESNIIALSNIHAIYHVFDGTPLSKEDISYVNPKNLSNDCKSLIKRKAYKNYEIDRNACCICEYSSIYRNSLQREERIILRRIIDKDIPLNPVFLHGESFKALTRISKDYEIGTFPILPLNQLLYDYIFSNSTNRYGKDELIDKFTILIKGMYPDLIEDNISLLSCIRLYISDIYSETLYNEKDVIYIEALQSILKPEENQKKKVVLPISSVTPDKLSINENEKKVSITDDISDNHEIVPLNEISLSEKENPDMVPTVEDIQEQISHEMVNRIAAEVEEKTNGKNNISKGLVKNIKNNETIIIYDDTTAFQFTSDLARSFYVCMEQTSYNERSGLIIYTSYNWRYYFYDIAAWGTEILKFYLNDPKKIVVSFNALQVLGSMYRYGEYTSDIQDLQVLYCIANNKEITPINEIIKNTLNKEGMDDNIQQTMPLYKEIYTSLMSVLSADTKKKLEYERTLRLYHVLASSYDGSFVYQHFNGLIERVGIRGFVFNFDWARMFNNPGTLYHIELPEFKVNNGLETDSFAMDVSLLFVFMPHIHRLKYRIIEIKDNTLIVYYEGKENDSYRFYDALMNGIRRAYARRFDSELHSKTNCVIYGNK